MLPKSKPSSRSFKKSASVGSGKQGEILCKMGGFLDSVINAITDGITVIDPNYKILYINQSLAHFYGYEDPEDVLGKKCYVAFRGSKKKCEFCPTEKIFETGKPEHDYLIAPDLHGNELHWEIYFYPIQDDKGDVESVVEYSRNITREKIMEKRVEESERKLVDIVSATRDIIAEFNTGMEMTFVSPNIEDFSGYSEEEVLSAESFLDFCTPESQKLLVKYFMARISGEPAPEQYEVEFIHKNGEVIPVEAKVSLRMEGDEIAGAVATIRDIRERKKAEEDLYKSEKKYRTLFEKSPTSITLLDKSGVVIDCNKSTEKLMGYSKKDIIGKRFEQQLSLSKKDLPKLKEKYKKLTKGKAIKPFELEIIRKGGGKRWINVSTAQIKKDKEIEGFQIIADDITERKEAERALRESEELYRTLIDTSPDGIVLTDLETNIIMTNPNGAQSMGYESPKELVGKSAFDLMAPEDLPRIMENVEEMFNKGKVKNAQFNFLKKDGNRLPVEFNASVLYDEKGEPTSFLGIARDLTERRKVEEQIRIANERLQYLLSSTSAVIYTSKTSGDYGATFISENVSRLVGFKPEKFLNTSNFWIDNIHPDDKKRILKEVTLLYKKGRYVYEYRFKCKNGRYIWVRDEMELVRDKDGNPIEIVGYWIDISNRKNAEEKLRESEERYRAIFEQAADSIVLIDVESGALVNFNEKAHENLGYTREEFKDLKIPEIEVIESPEEVQKHIKQIVRKGADTFETKHRTKDRDIRDIFVSTKAISIGGKDFIQSIWRDITEQKRAEEKLIESEERYRTFLENFHGIAYRSKEDWTPSLFQGAVKQITGYKEDEILDGKPSWDKVIHPEDLPKIFTKDEKKLHTKLNYSYVREYRIIRKDKQIRWIREYIKSVGLDPLILEGAIYDITERKAAEDALQESQEKYSNLFHQSNDPIILHDQKGNILDVNQRALEIFGYSEKEIIGLKVTKLHPKEALKKLKNAFKKIAKTKHVSFEIDFKKKNGEIFPAEVSSSLFEVGGKKVIQGIVRDISERKKAEEALKESEEMYRSLVEASPDAITVTDLDGRITFVSDRAIELTGVKSAKNVIGKNAFDFIAPEDQALALKNLEKTVETGFLRNTEYSMLKKDGTRYTGELNAASIKDASGNPKAFVGAIRDVTERKKAEEALRYRLAFEEMITSFSTHFLYMETDKIDEGINVSLRDLGIFAQADRCFVFTVYDDGKKMDNTHEWFAEGIGEKKNELQELDVSNLEWGMNLLKKLFPLNIPDVARLPKEAKADKKLLKSMKIKSFVSVPIVIGGSLYGFVGLGSTRKKVTWSSDIVTLLQFVSEMFANGLERKRAEQVLKESEEKFRSLAEQSPNMIFINMKGKIVYVNEECVKIMGYQRDEFYSPDFDFFSLISPESIELVKKSFAKHMSGEELPPYEYTIITKDEKRIEVIIATKLIRYQGDYAIMGIITDITKRKHAEEVIKGLKDFNESIVQSMDEGIMILDIEGIVNFTNPKIERILGYKRAKLVGEHWENFIASDYHRRMRDCYSENQRGSSDRFEAVLLGKDGTELPVLLSATPQFKEGGFAGILAVITDISERKREDIAREKLMRYKIKRGSTYLIKEKEFDKGKDLILELYKNHFKGLIITREHPEKIKRELDLNIPIYWLTKDPRDRSSVKPEFPILEKIIDDNIDRTTFVLLDRFDYLVTQYSFKETLNFIQHLNEMFYSRKAIFIISLDPDTLNPQEISLLEKETSILEKKYEERLNEDLMDLLDFVNRRNLVGDRPSFNEIGDQFRISRTTTRKRIRELIEKGLLSEVKSGRFKYLIVTDKGKQML